MTTKTFANYLKELRLATGLSLREFCLQHGIDPGNYSRLERGLFPPPQKEELLEKYATALGVARGSDDWLKLFDFAAASRGQLPKDLLSDDELFEKLPALFRTLRGRAIEPEKLDKFIDDVRRT